MNESGELNSIMIKARKAFDVEGLDSRQQNIFFYLYEFDEYYTLNCLIKYRWTDGCSIENSRYADSQRAKVEKVAKSIWNMLEDTELNWVPVPRDDLCWGKEFKIMKDRK